MYLNAASRLHDMHVAFSSLLHALACSYSNLHAIKSYTYKHTHQSYSKNWVRFIRLPLVSISMAQFVPSTNIPVDQTATRFIAQCGSQISRGKLQTEYARRIAGSVWGSWWYGIVFSAGQSWDSPFGIILDGFPNEQSRPHLRSLPEKNRKQLSPLPSSWFRFGRNIAIQRISLPPRPHVFERFTEHSNSHLSTRSYLQTDSIRKQWLL